MKKKKILTLNFLILALMMPSNIFAKEFKDVKRNGNVSWAYEYIDELSNKNILKGYEDGSFKPNNAVSFLETMEIIKSTLNPSEDLINDAVTKNLETLNSNGVPEWARGAVAFNIEHGTITVKTLEQAKARGFINSKVYPNRNSIAVYFARALGLNKSDDKKVLKFKDMEKISPLTLEYLPELIKANIFTSTGSDGNFNGNKAIKRSEIAAIISKSIKWVGNNDVTEKDPITEGESLIPEEDILPDNTDKNINTEENSNDNNISSDSVITEDTNSSVNKDEKNNDTVNFAGEILEITDAQGVRYLKVKITESDNPNFPTGNLITVHTSRFYNVGDSVSGSGKLGNNNLLDIKLN